MKYIHLFFKLIKAVHFIQKANSVHGAYHQEAKQFIQNHLVPSIQQYQGALPEQALLKIQWYMAELIWFCTLINRFNDTPLTQKQRRTILLGGALGAICDYLIDDIFIHPDKIQQLREPIKDLDNLSPIEQVYTALYHQFVDSVKDRPNSTQIVANYHLIFDAQVESLKQFDAQTPLHTIDQICRDKCGYSVLWLASMVRTEMSSHEKNAWYELGAYAQFCNDVQDMYKDLHNQINTFATARKNLAQIYTDLEQQRCKAFGAVKKMRLSLTTQEEILFLFHLMGVGILSKMQAFTQLCEGNFSFDRIKNIPKKKVRDATDVFELKSFILPKVFMFKYETAEFPYQFEMNI